MVKEDTMSMYKSADVATYMYLPLRSCEPPIATKKNDHTQYIHMCFNAQTTGIQL